MFWVPFFFFPSPSLPSIILKRSRNKPELAASARRCGRRCSLGFSGECSRFPTSTDRLLIWREPVLLLWCGTLCREGDTCRRVPFDPGREGKKIRVLGKIHGCGSDGGSAQREAEPCLFLRRECWNYYLLVMRSTLGAGGGYTCSFTKRLSSVCRGVFSFLF